MTMNHPYPPHDPTNGVEVSEIHVNHPLKQHPNGSAKDPVKSFCDKAVFGKEDSDRTSFPFSPLHWRRGAKLLWNSG